MLLELQLLELARPAELPQRASALLLPHSARRTLCLRRCCGGAQVRLLNITVPLIDPSLYIHRFASKLEFEEQTHGVAMTAVS